MDVRTYQRSRTGLNELEAPKAILEISDLTFCDHYSICAPEHRKDEIHIMHKSHLTGHRLGTMSSCSIYSTRYGIGLDMWIATLESYLELATSRLHITSMCIVRASTAAACKFGSLNVRGQ